MSPIPFWSRSETRRSKREKQNNRKHITSSNNPEKKNTMLKFRNRQTARPDHGSYISNKNLMKRKGELGKRRRRRRCSRIILSYNRSRVCRFNAMNRPAMLSQGGEESSPKLSLRVGLGGSSLVLGLVLVATTLPRAFGSGHVPPVIIMLANMTKRSCCR
jgi:hypothetical protein